MLKIIVLNVENLLYLLFIDQNDNCFKLLLFLNIQVYYDKTNNTNRNVQFSYNIN